MVCNVAGHKYLLNSIYFNTLFLVTDLLCPPVWDHVMCWNSTEAGTTALQPCPNYIHRFLLNGNRYLFSKITFMKFQQICLKGQKDHLCRLALVFTTIINVQFSERAIKKMPFLALTRPRGNELLFRNFLYNIPVPDKSFVIELLTCNFVFLCGIIMNLNHPLITSKKKIKIFITLFAHLYRY